MNTTEPELQLKQHSQAHLSASAFDDLRVTVLLSGINMSLKRKCHMPYLSLYSVSYYRRTLCLDVWCNFKVIPFFILLNYGVELLYSYNVFFPIAFWPILKWNHMHLIHINQNWYLVVLFIATNVRDPHLGHEQQCNFSGGKIFPPLFGDNSLHPN